MKFVTQYRAIVSHYTPKNATAVLRTYLTMLVMNRFVGKGAAGSVRLLSSTYTYSKRASLYGMFREIFIDQNYYIPPTDKPLTIIDCGTNIGVSLLYFRTQAPNATITAFEPNPHTYQIVQTNVKTNNLNVTIHPVGLGQAKTTATFYTDSKDLASQSGSTTGHLATKNYELTSLMVDIEPLSTYITGPVDILKLDVEGAEGEVLTELADSDTLRHIKQIFIEYHFDGVHTKYPLGAMLSILENAGFTYAINSQIELPYTIPTEAVCFSYKIVAWRNPKLTSIIA
jgi:FkbM family methyltransferase